MLRRAVPVRQAGFTLLELMVALALFVVLGIALVSLVRSSLAFLESGSQTGEVSDQIHIFEDAFSKDVRSVFALRSTPGVEPDVRMLYRTIDWPLEIDDPGSRRGGTKQVMIRVPVLAFVRTLDGEEKDRVTRQAGTEPGGTAYLDLNNDEREARLGNLKPLGGLMEVLYAAIPTPGTDGTVWRIVRAIRSPIGGEGSLLDPESFKGPEDVDARYCKTLLDGVLHFDVRFWGPETESWEEVLMPGNGGPYETWDSTRAVLPVSGEQGFPLARGAESLSEPKDDVFPRRIRARVTLVPAGRGMQFGRTLAELSGRETDAGERVDVDPASLVPARDDAGGEKVFLKVGVEWLLVSRIEGGRFSIHGRAQRGSPRLTHPAATRVLYGKTWEVMVDVPAFRLEPK